MAPEPQHAIEIREVRPADREALERFYSELGDESRRARFLGSTRGISDAAAGSFCSLNHVHDQGFVAYVGDDADQRFVGHLCLIRTGAQELELGIAVADGHQGRGVGRRLFEAAIAWATARHFTMITATCFTDNGRVLALLSSAPFGAELATSDAGVIDVTVPLLPPLEPPSTLWPQGAKPRRRSLRSRRVQPARVWRQPTIK